MIVFFFLDPTFNNLVDFAITQPMVCLSFSYNQHKNPKNVINIKVML
jgi:hypothetical protein